MNEGGEMNEDWGMNGSMKVGPWDVLQRIEWRDGILIARCGRISDK